MKLTLYREPSSEFSTLGTLFIDGKEECFTLEDPVREEKIYGETAIPAGTYNIAITFSPRFRMRLPLLLGVPDFSGVRIHAGNRPADTDGCILLGTVRDQDVVLNSRAALNRLMPKLEFVKNKGEKITIEIVPAAEKTKEEAA